MAFEGFSRVGLVVVGLGWALLLGAPRLSPLMPHFLAGTDPVVIALALILTGFGLAVLGVLRSGFGTLGRFFDAVLERSAARQRGAQGDGGENQAPEDEGPVRARAGDREYTIASDGTVEIETLFGVRRFASLEEARRFARS